LPLRRDPTKCNRSHRHTCRRAHHDAPLSWCKYCPSQDTTCSNAYIKAQAVDVPGIVIRRSIRGEAATHPLMRSYNQANTSGCPASQQTHLGSMDFLCGNGRVECCEQNDDCDEPTTFQHEKSSSAYISHGSLKASFQGTLIICIAKRDIAPSVTPRKAKRRSVSHRGQSGAFAPQVIVMQRNRPPEI
jgi:hypothetical protein